MKIYLLTESQVSELQKLNTQEATFVCCDHGLGPCVGENDFDDSVFINHKELLDSWNLNLEEIAENDA